jgi:hypothetical protein
VLSICLSSVVLKTHTSVCFLTGTVEIFLKRIYKKLPHLTPKRVIILAHVVKNSSALGGTEGRICEDDLKSSGLKKNE